LIYGEPMTKFVYWWLWIYRLWVIRKR